MRLLNLLKDTIYLHEMITRVNNNDYVVDIYKNNILLTDIEFKRHFESLKNSIFLYNIIICEPNNISNEILQDFNLRDNKHYILYNKRVINSILNYINGIYNFSSIAYKELDYIIQQKIKNTLIPIKYVLFDDIKELKYFYNYFNLFE